MVNRDGIEIMTHVYIKVDSRARVQGLDEHNSNSIGEFVSEAHGTIDEGPRFHVGSNEVSSEGEGGDQHDRAPCTQQAGHGINQVMDVELTLAQEKPYTPTAT